MPTLQTDCFNAIKNLDKPDNHNDDMVPILAIDQKTIYRTEAWLHINLPEGLKWKRDSNDKYTLDLNDQTYMTLKRIIQRTS